MANLSKIKRDQMIAFLEGLKESHSDDASIQAFNEIENHIRDKKYGLVWEEHSEEVDDLLKENIPILTADPERRLCKDASLPWSFIIEGDNWKFRCKVTPFVRFHSDPRVRCKVTPWS